MTERLRLAPAVLVGALVLVAGEALADDNARNLLDQKMRLVERLLARGDATRSGSEPYQAAQVLLQSARVYLQQDRLDLGAEALDEALRLAGEMARGAPASQRNHAALVERHQHLEEGVRTFRDAYIAAVGEPGEYDAEAQWLLQEARRQADAGDHRQAVTTAAQAYELTARALAAARANETVEHRLVFETPADEYEYELQRYRSSGLLVRMMANERVRDAQLLTAIDADVVQAKRLSSEAARQAGAGDLDDAIRLQEQASTHLMRALSKAGVFIPR